MSDATSAPAGAAPRPSAQPPTRRLRLNVAGRRRWVEVPDGDRIYAAQGRRRLLGPYAELCRAALDPGAVVLDVGANIGLTSIVAAERGARVVAVEAAPSNHAVLVRNTRAEVPGRVEPVHCAAGAAAGTVRFADLSTFGHVRTDGNLVEQPAVEVPLRTVDDIAAGLDRLDLVKIDVEGFEQDVLEGAAATLARHEPLVFLEFNTYCQIALFDRNPRRLAEYLLARFPELHVWRDGRLRSVHEGGVAAFLHENIVRHRGLDDLIATRRPERIARLRAVADRGSRGVRGLLDALRHRPA